MVHNLHTICVFSLFFPNLLPWEVLLHYATSAFILWEKTSLFCMNHKKLHLDKFNYVLFWRRPPTNTRLSYLIACGPALGIGLQQRLSRHPGPGPISPVFPCKAGRLYICLQAMLPGISWSASFPLTLWIPKEHRRFLIVAVAGLQRVRPIHLQRLKRISCSTGCCLVHCHSSWLLIITGQQICRMVLRQVLVNDWILLMVVAVVL